MPAMMYKRSSDSQAIPMRLGATSSSVSKSMSCRKNIAVHITINTIGGNQRRRSRSMSREKGPIVIFIIESFLESFSILFIGGNA